MSAFGKAKIEGSIPLPRLPFMHPALAAISRSGDDAPFF